MENSNGEPQSFFETPVTTPERSHYDRFTRRDEKIADINASLASKTRIIPEQQRLIMENALTKHWVPLSDKDSRRFGPPTPETERQFEKAVAAEVTRERELLRKQGFSEDQIAGKMSEREQQARVRLARDKKEFFTIRDKPYEAPKPKTNQELLSEARIAYDEAEKQFKTKLNSLLDDANEKTNGQARAAKIQLEKARKNLIHAFTGEDDPELVKKYTELLQRSATRDEAEAKIFRYKQENPRQEERDPRSFFTPDVPIERPKRPQPTVFTPQEEESMRSLFEEKTDDDDVFVDEKGEGTPVNPSSTNETSVAEVSETVEGSPYPFLEAEEIENPDTHSYEYYVVQGKREREQLRDAVSKYLADPREANLRQVRLGIQSLNQLSTMEVDDPKAAAMFDLLTSEYTGLAHDVELLLDPDHTVNPEQFWRWFNRDLEKIEKNIDSSVAPFYKQWLTDDDGLDGVNDRLKGLTEKFPDTALTDKTIDKFISDHFIDTSVLRTAYVTYNTNPSEENKRMLVAAVDIVGEDYKKLPNIETIQFRESDEVTTQRKTGVNYQSGIEKYKGYVDFTKDVQKLLNYSLEATGEIPSTNDTSLQSEKDDRVRIVDDILRDSRRAFGDSPLEYPVTARDMDEADRQRVEGLYPSTTRVEADEQRRRRQDVAREQGKLVRQDAEDEFYRKLFARNGVPEIEAGAVIEISDNNVDQFVTDHFVDVSPLLTEYQTYRDALNVLTALKQARNKGNQSITDDQVVEAENSAKQIVQRFEPIVEDIDEQLSEKGIDKSVTLQARRESPGVRDAQKLMTILSYQKQVSDLINLAEEATGKKTARNGKAIRRSDDEVQDLFANINENLSRIKSIEKGEQGPTANAAETSIAQENNQENPPVLQPENAVTLPPESVALKDTVHSITQRLNRIGWTLFMSRKEGAKNEIKPEIDELTALIETLNAIENPPVPVNYLVAQVEEFINFLDVLQNAPAENSLVAQIDYLKSKDYLTSAKNHVLRQEYEKEIEMAITQSTPEEKRTVPMSVADFSIYAQDLLLAYTKNVTSRYLYSRNPDVFDQNNLDLRRSNLTTLFNTVFVTDDIADSDDDFHQMAHSYVTAVKGLFRLVSEKQNDAELFSDPVKKREFLTQVEEQKRRVESFIF